MFLQVELVFSSQTFSNTVRAHNTHLLLNRKEGQKRGWCSGTSESEELEENREGPGTLRAVGGRKEEESVPGAHQQERKTQHKGPAPLSWYPTNTDSAYNSGMYVFYFKGIQKCIKSEQMKHVRFKKKFFLDFSILQLI